MAREASGGFERLLRAARRLGARAKRRGLPALVFVTDPARTPDPERIAGRLPRGSMVIFRAFGAEDAVARGRRLAAIARRRGLVLLAGADPALARAIGADGVHLPQRLARRAGALRRAHPRWLVIVAAHDEASARAARRAGAEAILLSPAFASASPSAGRPLGPVRFARLARAAGLPVYALGGVNEKTAPRVSGAVGLAAVEGLSQAS